MSGILFGLLFSMPWLLVYTLGASIGFLSILIVVGIILGYKMIRKDIYNTKQTKIYLISSSLFIVCLDIFLIMPILIQFIFQGTITADYLIALYNSTEFVSATILNLAVVIVMVIIPAVTLPIDFRRDKNAPSEGDEFLDEVKAVFKKHGALSKQTAVPKKEIKKELEKLNVANVGRFKKFLYIDLLKGFRIKTIKGKWYFKDKNRTFKFGLLLSIGLLIIFAGVWNIIYIVYTIYSA